MPYSLASNHLPIQQLPFDLQSSIIASRHKADTAIVFVHGFNGDPKLTWTGFDDFPTRKPEFKSSDMFFFKYKGLKSSAHAAASLLFDLLDGIANDPNAALGTLVEGELSENRKDGYQKLIVVAHSLGAVVSRWSLVRAAEEKRPWLSMVRTLFFAPAHRGSPLADLATGLGIGVPLLLKLFITGGDAKVPLLHELRQESPLLKDLERRTAELGATYPQLWATKVVIAEEEIVVNNWIFSKDPFPIAIRGTDHQSICKPSSEFDRRLAVLEEVMK